MVTLKIVQCHPGLTCIFNFWYSGTLVLSHDCKRGTGRGRRRRELVWVSVIRLKHVELCVVCGAVQKWRAVVISSWCTSLSGHSEWSVVRLWYINQHLQQLSVIGRLKDWYVCTLFSVAVGEMASASHRDCMVWVHHILMYLNGNLSFCCGNHNVDPERDQHLV